MSDFLSLEEILSAIEAKFISALSISNDSTLFNQEINNIDKLLKKLNSFLIEKKNEHIFSEKEKELLKKILNLIIKVEKLNKNKLGFFDSLNKYIYDNVNK